MKSAAWYILTFMVLSGMLLGACTSPQATSVSTAALPTAAIPTAALPTAAPSTEVPSIAAPLTAAPLTAAPPTVAPTQEPAEALTCEPKGDLVVAVPSVGYTLDNSQLTWAIESIEYLLYDTLVAVDFKGNITPGLASSWEISPDGLTYTFHLRQDVKFHDGTPFNSDAVKFHVDVFKKGPNAYFYAAISSVETPDPYTAVVKLSYPFPNLLNDFGNYYTGIMSPTAYQKLGPDKFSTNGVGTGPFILDQFTTGDKAVFHRNPDYAWGPDFMGHKGPACVNTITFVEMPEETTRLNALKSGQVQIVEEPGPNYVQELKSDSNYTILDSPQPALVFLALNLKNPPLDDLAVRKAISMAIDRQSILHTLWYDEGTVTYGVLPPALPEDSESKQSAFPYDLEGAKKVLADDGWKDENNDGVLEKNGKPLAFNLSSTNQTMYARTTEAVQNMLQKAGMKVDVRQYNDLTDLQSKGESQATMNWTKWSNADNIDFYFSVSNIPFPNWVGWDDPKGKDLLDKCWAAATWDERVKAYRELDNYLTSQVVWVTLFSQNEMRILSSNVTGLQQSYWGSPRYWPVRFVN